MELILILILALIAPFVGFCAGYEYRKYEEGKMIDNSKEYILCAAIKRDVPRAETVLKNNDIHKIELGYRHCDIRDRFPFEVKCKPSNEGFYTSKGRFVSRDEAERIARECGQIDGDLIGGVLTSEDLY